MFFLFLLLRDWIAVFILIFLSRSAGPRTYSRFPRMIWSIDSRFANVVGVVRFRQLVANRLIVCGIDALQEPAWLTRSRLKRRIHCNANGVLAGRNRRLPIPSIQNEKLAAQEEAVGIRPAMADSLVPCNPNRSAVSELRTLGLLSAGRRGSWIGVQHAEALLGSFPHKTGPRINQFVFRVVPEVIMVMAGCKLEQAVIGGDVSV